MADNFEIPIVRLTYDLADLRALQKDLEKVAKSGKKEFVDLAKQAKEVAEELESAKESQEEIFNKTHAQRIAQEKVYKVLKAESTIREIDKAYLKEKKKHLKEQRMLQKHAQREEIAHLKLLAKQGGDLAPAARRELRGRRVSAVAGAGAKAAGGIYTGGRAVFAGIGTAMKTVGRVLKMIENSPLWRVMMKLLDFNGLFRFNKELNATTGGIDALRGSLRDGAMAFGQIESTIWDNAEAMHSMGDNMRFLVKADDRLAALRGFETSALKAQEFTDTLGRGTEDVTLQAIALGRVLGMEGREVATYMGEFMRNMGVQVADIGTTFAMLIADGTEAGISQRFFLDQIRTATSALGMYEFNLSGVSKTLADMTKNSLQPAEVAMRDFQTLLQMGKGLNIGQLGASFQVAMRDSGFQQGMTSLTRMIGSRLDPAVFGEGLADRLAGMQRPQFNDMLDEMIATKGLNLDQQRELRSVYDALHALSEGQRGDFFELRQAMQTGALGPDFTALMVNAVAQQQFQGAELRDLNAVQLKVLSNFLGVSEDQLATMKDTIPSTDEIVANLNQQAEEQVSGNTLLQEAIAISQRIKDATENPDKSFEIIMEHLMRIIQRMVVKLVQMIMPYAVDLLAQMLRMLAGVIHAIVMMAEFVGDTGDTGRALYNMASMVGGGDIITKEDIARSGVSATDWDDIVDDIAKERSGRYVGGTRGRAARSVIARGGAENIADELQKAMVTGYAETAGSDLERLGQLIANREAELATLTEQMKNSDGERKQEFKEQVQFLRELLREARDARAAGMVALGEAATAAGKGGFGAGFSSADAAAAGRTIRGAADALENFQKSPNQSPDDLRAAIDRVRSAGTATYKAAGGPGQATGGLFVRPQIAAFAEAGPEVNLPLTAVPKVMADVMKRAGVGAGGVNIGAMHFHLPETAAANYQVWSQSVRRIFFEELKALNKAHRAV